MKLPQLTLRDLFWLVALVAMGFKTAEARGRPELEPDKFVAEAHEITLEQMLKIFSYHKARVFFYAGSDEDFDYVWLRHQRLGKVTLYRFKLPRGEARLSKRFHLGSEEAYNLTWAVFPDDWHFPLKPDEPPKEAAVKSP
jgi:hypothetical protein